MAIRFKRVYDPVKNAYVIVDTVVDGVVDDVVVDTIQFIPKQRGDSHQGNAASDNADNGQADATSGKGDQPKSDKGDAQSNAQQAEGKSQEGDAQEQPADKASLDMTLDQGVPDSIPQDQDTNDQDNAQNEQQQLSDMMQQLADDILKDMQEKDGGKNESKADKQNADKQKDNKNQSGGGGDDLFDRWEVEAYEHFVYLVNKKDRSLHIRFAHSIHVPHLSIDINTNDIEKFAPLINDMKSMREPAFRKSVVDVLLQQTYIGA